MEVESTLSSYRIFNAVAETGNLSRAAKELYISQPAISKAVSKLEQCLAVKLFTRNSRGVKLTEEGQLLYEYTSSAFTALRQGEESIKKLHTAGPERIRLGAGTPLCKHLLLPCLQSFMKQNPEIKVTVECHNTAELMALLAAGKLDLAMIDGPSTITELHFQPVTEIHSVLAATPTYLNGIHYSERSAAKDTSSLSQATFLLLNKKDTDETYPEAPKLQQLLSSGTILEAENMDLLLEFTKIGLGIGYIIREFALAELSNGSLTELTDLCPPLTKTIGFACKKNLPQNESVKRFLTYTKEKYAYDETT